MTTPTSHVLSTAPAAAGRRSRNAIVLSSVALALASLGTWLTVDRTVGANAPAVVPASPVPTWTSISSPSLERVEITGLEKRLVRAGYSIKVDGRLDPVRRSALADYLQLDSARPLGSFLAAELDGTVFTGLRNPAAWNRRFGLDRKTSVVERPLSGPGGQLDLNGNVVER
jgi:hypothetical protein